MYSFICLGGLLNKLEDPWQRVEGTSTEGQLRTQRAPRRENIPGICGLDVTGNSLTVPRYYGKTVIFYELY